MNRYIQHSIIALLIITALPSVESFSATTPTKSNTTNPKSPLYYNNDLSKNGALSQAAKDFAANNPKKAEEIMAKNNNQCGINCAKDMEAASKSDIKTLNAAPVEGVKVNSTAIEPINGLNAAPSTPTNVTPSVDCKTDSSNSECNNLLGISSGSLRQGDVNMESIVTVILNIIKFLLGIAGTVSIFSLIYHAVKMQLSSGITGDSSGVEHAKKGMTGAIIGFLIAISSWFIVTRIVQLLVEVS